MMGVLTRHLRAVREQAKKRERENQAQQVGPLTQWRIELGLQKHPDDEEAAAKELEQLHQDAARYRWLRDRNDWNSEPRVDEADGTKWELCFYSPQCITDPTDDDNLDAAVDAAIEEDQAIQRAEREPNPTAYNDGNGGLRWHR